MESKPILGTIDQLAAYLEENPDSEPLAPELWLSELTPSDYERALGLPELVVYLEPAKYPSNNATLHYTISWEAYLLNARHLITKLADVAVMVWIYDERPVSCYPVRMVSEFGRKLYYPIGANMHASHRDGYPIMFLFKEGSVLDITPSLNMLAASRWLEPENIWTVLKEQAPDQQKLSEAIVFAARSGNLALLDLALLERSNSSEVLDDFDLGEALLNTVLCGQSSTSERLLTEIEDKVLKKYQDKCIEVGIEAGSFECMDLLLSHPASKPLKQSSARSLFEIALTKSSKPAFEYLVSKGLKPKFSKNEFSNYALNAIKKRRVDLATMLWDEYGATPSYTASGDNAMYHAAGYADTRLLESLQERGISFENTNTRGYSPLHKACVTENIEALAWFIKRAPSFAHSFKGETNLIARSIDIPKPKTVTFLLESGFDPNAIVGQKTSLLDYARSKGNDEITRILIQYGAKEAL